MLLYGWRRSFFLRGACPRQVILEIEVDHIVVFDDAEITAVNLQRP
jgi:hypothetical protein